jgi:cobalt-zinc-cadmium efflux system membrane fusion protein
MLLRAVTAGARRLLSLLPNVLVLVVLLGLFWWGRAYRWKVPSFAAVIGIAAEGEKGEASRPGRTEVEAISTSNPALRDSELPLHRVRLRGPETVRKAGVETAPVTEQALAQYVAAYGAISFDQTRYAELSPKASGTVWCVLKAEGEPVHKGEVLALVAAPEVADAKTKLLQGLLQVEVRTRVVHRLQSLLEGVIALKQLDEAEAALAEAQLHLFEVQQRLINLGLPLDVKEMRKLSEEKRTHLLHRLGVPEAVLKDTDPIQVPTSLLPLIAPFDGEVVKRDMVRGEVVTTSQVQMIVADTRHLWIQLDVRQEDAPEIQIGQEVRFESDNPGGKPGFGRVSWIRREADPKTRTVHVRAEVANPEELLRPNTFGTGHILIRPSAPVPAVPTPAIQREGNVYFVFVRVGAAAFEQRRIVPGIRGHDFTEVRSGVQPGEIVVTSGSHLLKSAITHSLLAGAS